jgi:hypothetical protein
MNHSQLRSPGVKFLIPQALTPRAAVDIIVDGSCRSSTFHVSQDISYSISRKCNFLCPKLHLLVYQPAEWCCHCRFQPTPTFSRMSSLSTSLSSIPSFFKISPPQATLKWLWSRTSFFSCVPLGPSPSQSDHEKYFQLRSDLRSTE